MSGPGHRHGYFIDEARGKLGFSSGVDEGGVWSAITVYYRGEAISALPREVQATMARMFIKAWLLERGFEPLVEEGGHVDFKKEKDG